MALFNAQWFWKCWKSLISELFCIYCLCSCFPFLFTQQKLEGIHVKNTMPQNLFMCKSNSLISSYIAIIMLLWCLLPFLLLALTFVAELFLSKTALRYCLFKENVSFLHQCLFWSVYFLSSCSMGFFMLLWVCSMILTPKVLY